MCVSRADRPVLWPCLMDVKQLRILYYILAIGIEMAITIGIIPFQISSRGYAAQYYQQPNIRDDIISLQYRNVLLLIITMV